MTSAWAHRKGELQFASIIEGGSRCRKPQAALGRPVKDKALRRKLVPQLVGRRKPLMKNGAVAPSRGSGIRLHSTPSPPGGRPQYQAAASLIPGDMPDTEAIQAAIAPCRLTG
jgi:hypothetical protein